MTDAPDGVPPIGNRQDRTCALGPATFTLRFSFVAAAALKEAWGIPWQDDKQLLERVFSRAVTDIPVLLWGLMQTHHPEMTREAVLKLCDDNGLSDDLRRLWDAGLDAIAAGWGAPPKKKPEAAPAAKPSAKASRRR